jgi:hypothetical protein
VANGIPPFETQNPSVFEDLKMAEGVVFEPFLPSSDQGRKGGFATLVSEPQKSAYFLSRIQ